jgi:type I restriction enzyme M protein
MSEASAIVQRVWNYCNVLRDDGVSYGDYLEQLTYLLFLKMVDELEEEYEEQSHIPQEYRWSTLTHLRGDALEVHYRTILTELGKGNGGLVPIIFRKAQNKIQDPAKLERLIRLIEKETWIDLELDVKAEIYEGLLEKNAQDIKSGAGQYFTPRPLIQAIVEVMQPKPGQLLADPACGTGGFLLAAYEYLLKHHSPLNRSQQEHLRYKALRGWEIVDSAARLCVMNLYLHNIGAESEDSPIEVNDSLITSPGAKYDMVLTNPPFGKKSSVTYVTDEGDTKRENQTLVRDDFWATTSNKQLNFVQHVFNMLKIDGSAAVVVPDNVLFEGGAGEKIRRKLLQQADVHLTHRRFLCPGGQGQRPLLRP